MYYQTLTVLVVMGVLAGCSGTPSAATSSIDGVSASALPNAYVGLIGVASAESAGATERTGASARYPRVSSGVAAIAPSITGLPASTARMGQLYTFTPIVTGTGGGAMTFAIVHCPAWATFDNSTGTVTGTPTAADAGTTPNILISVTIAGAVYPLGPFSIVVTGTPTGTAMLSWTPPTQNTDGSAISDLVGYRISFGASPTVLDQTIDIEGASVDSYVVGNLQPGTWYFAVQAYSASNVASAPSNTVSKIIL